MPTHTTLRSDGREELTAAQAFDLVAHPVQTSLLRNVIASGKTSATQPMKWYKQIGEIHFGINRGAKIAGYANITARNRRKDGQPGRAVTTGLAAEVAARFESPYGGQRGLIERFFTLMKVPGDMYMIRIRDGNEIVGYDVVGAAELDLSTLPNVDARNITNPEGPIRRIVLPFSREIQSDIFTEIEPRDFLGRIWRPAIQYVQLADSPLAALDTQCEILHLLTLGLKGKLLSRLALNGILYWPSEVSDIRSGSPDGTKTDAVNENQAFARLIQAATWAISNFEDPKSALPIFASGPAQYADAIKHIILDREIYETDMKLRAEMIDRILVGLDIQKQQTEGEGAETRPQSFATSDDEIRVNVKPDVETFMWAASRLALNREFAEANIAPSTASKYMLWYDLSDANTFINSAEDARQALDRLGIDYEAFRRHTGFKPEDAPKGDELIRMTGLKMNDPYLATFKLPGSEDIDWDKVGSMKKGPNEGTPADKPEASPGNQPGKPGGKSESDTPARLKPKAA